MLLAWRGRDHIWEGDVLGQPTSGGSGVVAEAAAVGLHSEM